MGERERERCERDIHVHGCLPILICMFVYIYMYIYIYICMYTHTFTCVHSSMSTPQQHPWRLRGDIKSLSSSFEGFHDNKVFESKVVCSLSIDSERCAEEDVHSILTFFGSTVWLENWELSLDLGLSALDFAWHPSSVEFHSSAKTVLVRKRGLLKRSCVRTCLVCRICHSCCHVAHLSNGQISTSAKGHAYWGCRFLGCPLSFSNKLDCKEELRVVHAEFCKALSWTLQVELRILHDRVEASTLGAGAALQLGP